MLVWLTSKDKKLLRLHENGNENLFLLFTPPTCLPWEAFIFSLSAPFSHFSEKHLLTWPCRLNVAATDKQTSGRSSRILYLCRFPIKQNKQEHDAALRVWIPPPPLFVRPRWILSHMSLIGSSIPPIPHSSRCRGHFVLRWKSHLLPDGFSVTTEPLPSPSSPSSPSSPPSPPSPSMMGRCLVCSWPVKPQRLSSSHRIWCHLKF